MSLELALDSLLGLSVMITYIKSPRLYLLNSISHNHLATKYYKHTPLSSTKDKPLRQAIHTLRPACPVACHAPLPYPTPSP